MPAQASDSRVLLSSILQWKEYERRIIHLIFRRQRNLLTVGRLMYGVQLGRVIYVTVDTSTSIAADNTPAPLHPLPCLPCPLTVSRPCLRHREDRQDCAKYILYLSCKTKTRRSCLQIHTAVSASMMQSSVPPCGLAVLSAKLLSPLLNHQHRCGFFSCSSSSSSF